MIDIGIDIPRALAKAVEPIPAYEKGSMVRRLNGMKVDWAHNDEPECIIPEEYESYWESLPQFRVWYKNGSEYGNELIHAGSKSLAGIVFWASKPSRYKVMAVTSV